MLVVAALHLLATSSATTPQHDGLVSLQLAAAGLDDWAELTDNPEWRPAGDYLTVVDPPDRVPPSGVADQAARLDIHPPGYPLLLTAWQPVAGRSLRVLLLVNVAAAALLAWVASGLARRLGAGPAIAAVAGLAAAASPGMLVTGLELRPYLVAALVGTTLATWGVAVVERGGEPSLGRGWWAAGAALTTALALLSFAGVFVVVGTALAVGVRSGPLRRRVQAVSAIVAGGLTALALWPHAFEQLAEQSRRQANPLFEAAAIRSGRVVRSLGSVIWFDAATWVAAGLLLGLVGLVVLAVRRHGRPAIALAIITMVGVAGHAGFYLVGRSQRWAMTPKYIAFVLPLVAVLAVVALRDRRGAVLAAGALTVGIGLNWAAIVDVVEDPPPEAVAHVDAVMVTNPRRGVGLRQLWHVAPDVPAVVGAPSQLKGRVSDVPSCPWLLVHNDQGGAGTAATEEFDDHLRAAGWELHPADPPSAQSRAAIVTREDCDG